MDQHRFFVTCGRGMDYFVIKELHNVAGITNIEVGDGKVFFDFKRKNILKFNVEPLTSIKSAERLFLNVFKGKKPFKSTIDKLFHDIKTWSKFSLVWKSQQGEIESVSGENDDCNSSSKRQKIAPELRYRINFKCTGKAATFRSSPTFAHVMSKKVQSELNWITDLKNPDLEIYVHWNDEFILVGFPITKLPLSKRSYFKSISLRTTVCWAMAYCADIKPLQIVCDPMCGRGTILIELIKSWNVNFVIGIDNSPEQLEYAKDNCIHANVLQHTQLMHASIEALPLKDELIDVVLCDFPFGLKHGTLDYAQKLLPQALKEIDRVCRSSGKIVILISEQHSAYLLKTTSNQFPRSNFQTSKEQSWWKNISRNDIKLGSLSATICTFQKRQALHNT